MLLTTVFIITRPVTLVTCNVIKTYQRNKPLGMQTLLSRTIITFTNTLSLAAFLFDSSLMCIDLLGPFKNEPLSMALSVIPYMSVMAFLLIWLVMTIVKYLSVYHNDWIATLDDSAITKKITLSLLIFPPIATLIEFGCFISIHESVGFIGARYGLEYMDSAKREAVVQTLGAVIALAMGFLQLRIELDRYRNQETSGLVQYFLRWIRSQDNSANDNANFTFGRFGYSITDLRFFILLAIPVFIIIIAGPASSSELNIAVGCIVGHAIAPSLVISNHKGMRTIFVAKLKTMWGLC